MKNVKENIFLVTSHAESSLNQENGSLYICKKSQYSTRTYFYISISNKVKVLNGQKSRHDLFVDQKQ